MSFTLLATFAALSFSLPDGFAQSVKQDASTPQITLPGGATTLQETFDDWIVTCGVANGAKICAASQQQMQQNGQRVLAVEIKPEADHTRIDVVLPFGILVSEPISYQIGEANSVQTTKIKTCFPGGCVATFNLNADQLRELRSAKEVKMVAPVDNNPKGFDFTISLKGFPKAYDRVNQLMKS